MDKKTVIIGGILAALGVVGLVVLTRGSGVSSPVQAPAAAAPLQIPAYPQAPPLPAINVVATPYYQTFNIAPDKSLQPSATSTTGDKSACACTQETTVDFSNAFVKQSVENLRARFMLTSGNASNIIEQFPPHLYPWMYQNVGSA